MPYFAYFKPYDYPILQFPGFYNALFDIFPNKNHAKLRWKNAVRKIFHRASAQLSPSHPSTSNYRFFIGFSFWIIFIKIYIYSVDSCNSCSFQIFFRIFVCANRRCRGQSPIHPNRFLKATELLRMLVRIFVLDYLDKNL